MNIDTGLGIIRSPESGMNDKKEEPWPLDAQLYQPPEATQLLLPERASCLAVKTYLRMCGLPFVERFCDNAEFMTPGGRLTKLPMLRLNHNQVIAEFQPIVAHVEATQPSHALSSWLSEEQCDDMRCAVNHAENTFTLAELYVSFLHPQTYYAYTGPRIGAAHPWPLSMLRRFAKWREALRLLKVYQWYEMDEPLMKWKVADCCRMLVNHLSESEEQLYLCGQQPCELDALVFGHVVAMLNTRLPDRTLSHLMRQHPELVAYCRRIDQTFHEGKQLAGED